ncbi:hypothetical protein QBC39DRAFT_333682 [Podospora conica]|nr:hypothetical protein QBC39DRAFT_333682 [Schizothecium conicum]
MSVLAHPPPKSCGAEPNYRFSDQYVSHEASYEEEAHCYQAAADLDDGDHAQGAADGNIESGEMVEECIVVKKGVMVGEGNDVREDNMVTESDDLTKSYDLGFEQALMEDGGSTTVLQMAPDAATKAAEASRAESAVSNSGHGVPPSAGSMVVEHTCVELGRRYAWNGGKGPGGLWLERALVCDERILGLAAEASRRPLSVEATVERGRLQTDMARAVGWLATEAVVEAPDEVTAADRGGRRQSPAERPRRRAALASRVRKKEKEVSRVNLDWLKTQSQYVKVDEESLVHGERGASGAVAGEGLRHPASGL